MFPLYPFNPFIPIGQRNQIKLIDVGGIYELKTNAQQVTDASVDYGINPCYYNALCEVDEAVTNLIDKIGEATKIITLSSIYKSV